MESKGYIKLHRSILDCEWYGDTTTTSVFIHLLLTANWEETRWRGQTIKRGETKTTYKDIAKALGISIQSTRTAISHLESTGEITRRVTNHRQFITIENYEKYQGYDLPTNTQTNTQDTDNLTSDQQATNTHNIKEYKEIKEVKKTNNIKSKSYVTSGIDHWNQWNIIGEIEASKGAIGHAYDSKKKKVVIYHDLEGTARWASGKFRAKNEYTKSYVKFIESYDKKIKIIFIKVKGHSGNKYNDLADELAKKAVKEYIVY